MSDQQKSQDSQGSESSGEMRCGYVALVGLPNAGKSSLLNALIGQKLAIVTPKAQTTRFSLRAIVMADSAQLIFCDAPGLFNPADVPKRQLERTLQKNALQTLAEADVVTYVIDAAKMVSKGVSQDDWQLLEKLQESTSQDPEKSVAVILNKTDLVSDKNALLPMMAELSEKTGFQDVFLSSATREEGLEVLVAHLADNVPAGPWLYDAQEVTDTPMRVLAAEITREKLFLNVHDELPYNLTVVTETWENFKNGSVKIEQSILINREAHKKMVLGKGGQRIKAVRKAAQTDISEMAGCPIHLFLTVKVKENWQDDPKTYMA